MFSHMTRKQLVFEHPFRTISVEPYENAESEKPDTKRKPSVWLFEAILIVMPVKPIIFTWTEPSSTVICWEPDIPIAETFPSSRIIDPIGNITRKGIRCVATIIKTYNGIKILRISDPNMEMRMSVGIISKIPIVKNNVPDPAACR